MSHVKPAIERNRYLPELCAFLLDLDSELTSGRKDQGDRAISGGEERLSAEELV